MPKRLLFTVDDETFRRFRHMAIDHGTSNAQLLERLLDAHQQLLVWQAQRERSEVPAPSPEQSTFGETFAEVLSMPPLAALDHVIRPVDGLTMPSEPSEPVRDTLPTEPPEDVVAAMLAQVEGDVR